MAFLRSFVFITLSCLLISAVSSPLSRPNQLSKSFKAHVTRSPRLQKRGGKTTTTPTDGYAYNWLTSITVGTPPQAVRVGIDTGSGDFWVYGPTTTSRTVIPNLPFYDPAKSSTFKNATEGITTWQVLYGDGSLGDGGYICNDDVALGDFMLPGAPVKIPTWFIGDTGFEPDNSGIMGIPPLPLDGQVPPGSTPPFITTIASNLDNKVFTANLFGTGTGFFEFGNVDATQYTGSLTTVPANTAQAASWLLENISYTIAGEAVPASAGTSCMVDSGGGGLNLEGDIAATYYGKIPGSRDTSAAQDGSAWSVPCDAQLPPLEMHFGNVPPGQPNNPAVIPGDMIKGGVVQGNENSCAGGIVKSERGNCGGLFFEANFLVFTIAGPDGPSVGFAPKSAMQGTF